MGRPKDTTREEFFWSKVKFSMLGCWEWTGYRDNGGYGRFGKDLAHRLAYEFFNRKRLDLHMDCCHRCDNPSCVNPRHLFEGTTKDNIRDCIIKGRFARTLDDAQVAEIKRLLSLGTTHKEIAVLFNVSRQHVGSINTGHRHGNI